MSDNVVMGVTADLDKQFVNGELGETTPESNTITLKEKMNMSDEVKAEDPSEENPVQVTETSEETPDEVVETTTEEEAEPQKEVVDFSGKDFEDTQKVLNMNAKMNSLRKEMDSVKAQKKRLTDTSFKNPQTVSVGEDSTINNADDVIQYHLDRFTIDELRKYIGGSLSNQTTRDRIDEFFENPETHEVLELSSEPNVKTVEQEYDFKRGMLIYFKQNDDYLAKIDDELEKLNAATAELEENVNSVLNPLKDNVLAYAQYLVDQSEPAEDDTVEVTRKKKADRKKARAIRSGFTLENMIELIKKNPSIKRNALNDFHNENRLKSIGERYANKLHTAKIDFNLFSLLSDDVRESLEYRVLPQGEYPAGLEGFTVFFIIRSLSMSLPNPEDIIFHASVQVAFTQFIEGKCDPDIAETMKESIKKFLSYFD